MPVLWTVTWGHNLMSQTKKHCEPLVAVWLRPSTTERICCKQVAEKPRGEHLKNDVCMYVTKHRLVLLNTKYLITLFFAFNTQHLNPTCSPAAGYRRKPKGWWWRRPGLALQTNWRLCSTWWTNSRASNATLLSSNGSWLKLCISRVLKTEG